MSKAGLFFASCAQQTIMRSLSALGQSGGTASRSGLAPATARVPTWAGSSSSKGISLQIISNRIIP
eukprot:CAMPEP_0180783338 /NCGR_PEP_ID=MMETSP1038_2-20121128/48931_1 /TAXON_ID=632150 /ORGANISM="Azadinium spinosum, Strain 3D9" /LENGTH=65 /DNA_ID=CAMNT_0022819821 /DNA_START=54 /DNA_END=251 /DNA_ORIENTATION=-